MSDRPAESAALELATRVGCNIKAPTSASTTPYRHPRSYYVIDSPRPDREAVPTEPTAEEPWLVARFGPRPTAERLLRIREREAHIREEHVANVIAASLSRRNAAHLLSVNVDTVTRRVYAGRLVGFICRNRWWLPSWQFTSGGALPGLQRVIAAWPGDLLSLSDWAVTPAVDLAGQTPAEALSRRRLMRVLELERAIEVDGW
jgi:hypothetical protein